VSVVNINQNRELFSALCCAKLGRQDVVAEMCNSPSALDEGHSWSNLLFLTPPPDIILFVYISQALEPLLVGLAEV
jgi:hypothetical protein